MLHRLQNVNYEKQRIFIWYFHCSIDYSYKEINSGSEITLSK